MLLIAALSLSLFGHLPRLPALGRGRHDPAAAADGPRLPARVGPWRVEGRLDRFSGTRGCAITAAGVSLHRGALLFRVAAGGDTRRAVFRIDGGPPRAVADVFDRVETLGFFPQRGWLRDPRGGEAVLPAAEISAARTVTIRARTGARPERFKVSRLDEAMALARSAGCGEPIP